ncbi:circadian clock protein KaiC [Panacagrimonas perspica]|uniref:non-specific serine/threonine protein kinase n=1 Tax=Panacagrimonas perspica TaxID=381431 RepID=A0A4R7NZ38_9GAMM|nr:ATPase domain-containing protein [Panacagrimonas perspica]TDU26398.1 circadian clock protein KaiC [Panacagrimonas perspica]THD02035.1 hypothetical protein B1810_16185 [Panacagrimonas perspica]
MNSPKGKIEPLDQIPSGIPGLDTILRGGFLRAGITIIQGVPGAGKTILGNQLCYNHVANGGKAIYVTLLAESHARMMLHMSQLSFFNADLVPERLYLISAFRVLEESGLKGLQDLLRREIQKHGATVVVLDGLVAAEESATSAREFKKFIHELQTQASLTDCTIFLLTGAGSRPVAPEHTMVDGILELKSENVGRRTERVLVAHKMRGVDVLRGHHAMRITAGGMEVFPRIEAVIGDPDTPPAHVTRALSSGLPVLDRITGGGFPQGSTTLLVGAVGVGKTTLGLQFLSQCTADAPGVMLSFYDGPAALLTKAGNLGLNFADAVAQHAVEIIWQPITEGQLDEICDRFLRIVRLKKAKRVFIDGIGGLSRIAGDQDRLARVLAALNIEFQLRGVTAIYTAESDLSAAIHGKPFDGLSLQGVSSVAHNIVLMRYVELRSELHRMISVLKVRSARIDSGLHLYTMGPKGIEIEDDTAGAARILHALESSGSSARVLDA